MIESKNNQETIFQWTEKGYKQRLYCYYCKMDSSNSNKVNEGGYGCDNCRHFSQNSGII